MRALNSEIYIPRERPQGVFFFFFFFLNKKIWNQSKSLNYSDIIFDLRIMNALLTFMKVRCNMTSNRG